MRHPVCVAASLVAALLAVPALQAVERIIRYDSDIRIDADASLRVTETIEVYAEGRRIRRGIYRDFPTTYADRLGNRIRVDLSVLSVRRDGAAEPYSLESLANGVRIRIGRADRFLDTGAHTYTITYHTERQLGFFADYDELYWNVTGNGWGFPIESATAKVTLPGGARAVQQVAYTGPQGAKGRAFRQSVADDVLTWETTRPLDPGEGLTIAVAWPKGFVTAPSGADEAGWFLRDNAATGVALVGTALMLLYYVLAWRRFGKDPEGGAIFPRFEPPEGLSPAATRFIRLMNFDKKAYSAALINMAVKGYLVIEEEEGSYRLLKEPDAPITVLANGERRIAKKLLRTRDSILLDKKHHELLATSVSKLRHSLENEYEKACFARNTVFFVTGLVLSFGVVVLTAMVDGNPARFGPAILVALASAGLTFGVLHFWGDDTDPTFKVLPFRALPVAGALAIVLKIGMFVILAGVSSFGAMVLQLTTNPVQTLCFALLGGLNITFFFLLKRPTLAGRSLMDEIEGFRMYLSVAEEERLKLSHPPDKTPKLFEKYLPYALALDVENEWNDQFATLLAAASTAPGESTGYRPRWYRGTAWPSRARRFVQQRPRCESWHRGGVIRHGPGVEFRQRRGWLFRRRWWRRWGWWLVKTKSMQVRSSHR